MTIPEDFKTRLKIAKSKLKPGSIRCKKAHLWVVLLNWYKLVAAVAVKFWVYQIVGLILNHG